jgi:hypothetical protein
MASFRSIQFPLEPHGRGVPEASMHLLITAVALHVAKAPVLSIHFPLEPHGSAVPDASTQLSMTVFTDPKNPSLIKN